MKNEFLRTLRGKRTISDVASAIGVTRSALVKYERGERIPRDEIKIKIADYYGKSVEEIFFVNVVHESRTIVPERDS